MPREGGAPRRGRRTGPAAAPRPDPAAAPRSAGGRPLPGARVGRVLLAGAHVLDLVRLAVAARREPDEGDALLRRVLHRLARLGGVGGGRGVYPPPAAPGAGAH